MGWLLPPGGVTRPFHRLSYTHKRMHRQMHAHTNWDRCQRARSYANVQTCAQTHACAHTVSTQVRTNIILRLALGHIFLATKVILIDKHILITWAPVA